MFVMYKYSSVFLLGLVVSLWAGPEVGADGKGALTVGILNGDRQAAEPGRFNPIPFDLAVWDASGTHPLIDAPVTFTIRSGNGLLAVSNLGAPLLVTSLTVNTDQDGTAKAYYQHPPFPGIVSEIKATAGGKDVIFQSTSLGAALVGVSNSLGQSGTSGSAQSSSVSNPAASASQKERVRTIALAETDRAKARGAQGPSDFEAAVGGGLQLILQTQIGTYRSVDTSTWAIGPVAP